MVKSDPEGKIDSLAWQQVLANQSYPLKHCGWWGGYMLGFTRNYPQAARELSAFNLETIPVYTPDGSNQ